MLGLGAARLRRRQPGRQPGRRLARLLRALQGALRGRQLRRARTSATPATGRRARRCSTPPPSTRPAAPAKGRRGSSRRCWASPRSSSSSLSARAASAAALASGLLAAFAVAVYPPFIHSTGELMSEPPAILTLPAAVLAFLWAERAGAPARPGSLPGLLFGLTAMFRPEYLFVGAAFVVLAAIRVGRGARLAARASPAPALLLAALLLPIVPWTIRNVDRPRPRGADLDRQRQGALRRHLPARRRRIPAGQGDPRRALPAPRPDAALRSAERSRPDAAVRPRRRPLSRTCRATRPWARSASRTSPSTSAKTRSATWR